MLQRLPSPSIPPQLPRRDVSNLYGYRELAELCEAVIIALFACPPTGPISAGAGARPRSSTHPSSSPRLVEFVAYALHRTRLPTLVTYQALYLLKRLKQRFPSSRGSSGHRVFIAALMLSSKVLCDDTYSNKSWAIVGQGLFSLTDINKMEYELFSFLGYKVNVPAEQLLCFADLLEQGYLDQALYVPSRPVGPSSSAGSTTGHLVPDPRPAPTPDSSPSRTDAFPPTRSTRSFSSPFRPMGTSSTPSHPLTRHAQPHPPPHPSFPTSHRQGSPANFPMIGALGPPAQPSLTSPWAHDSPLGQPYVHVHAPAQPQAQPQAQAQLQPQVHLQKPPQKQVPAPLTMPLPAPCAVAQASLAPALEQLEYTPAALPSPSAYWPYAHSGSSAPGRESIDSVSASSGGLHAPRSCASSSGSTSHGGGGFVRTPSSDEMGHDHDWLLRGKGAAVTHLVPMALTPRIDGQVAL